MTPLSKALLDHIEAVKSERDKYKPGDEVMGYKTAAPLNSSLPEMERASVSDCGRSKIALWSANFMKRDKEPVAEIKCPACEGTGFQRVKQPAQPGRRIYPATCKECLGKGRLAIEAK